jgi:hypothetical protein
MKVDMSPHTVTMGIKQTSDLRRLCIALGRNSDQQSAVSDQPKLKADSSKLMAKRRKLMDES